MNDHIALLTLSCCLTAAACSIGADPGEASNAANPEVVTDESRPAPASPAAPETPSGARALSARCTAPPAYVAVAIGELLDHPEAYDGALVQTVAPLDSVMGFEMQCWGYPCEQPDALQMQLVGPEDELDLEGGLVMFPANGTTTARVWGTFDDSGKRPVLVVEGFCDGGAVPCALAGPDCPSTMACVFDDCAWNGGNCGINPHGTCQFSSSHARAR
jgi:hypothetical protein